MTAADLRYPIGSFPELRLFSSETRAAAIADIQETPTQLAMAVSGLTDAQLDTPYRPEGWTVRQVVHHLADAHMVLSTRVRTALTAPDSRVTMWDEEGWAGLPDAKTMPIGGSLTIVEAVHDRAVHLLRALTPDDWSRAIRHPEWGIVPVDTLVNRWAWHGKHHTAHILGLRRRTGW